MLTDAPQDTSLSKFGKFRSRLEKGMRQPSMKQIRRPSTLFKSSHRRQKSVETLQIDMNTLTLTPNRTRSHSNAGSNINVSPDIDRVSNFSSPERSVGSLDSLRLQRSRDLSPSSQPFDSPSRGSITFFTPIPRISITSDDDVEQPFPTDTEHSRLTRLRNRTKSLFFDPYESMSRGISPTRARSSSIEEKTIALPRLTKTSSDSKQETIAAISTESMVKKQEKELLRKRSRTYGSLEGDLYHRRSGSIVKTIGNIVMLKQRAQTTDATTTPTGSVSDGSSDAGIDSQLPSVPAVGIDDTPEEYLEKLMSLGLESEISTILSNDNSEFLKKCLELYMEQSFNFTDEALDISLRRFLLVCDLPKETQQIDRVLDCFSKIYFDCNLQYWNNKDQIYFLTFSLVMLHTDHFNSNNKKKMTKEQFVRNTRVDNQDEKICNSFLTREILEYLYDNITLTKFIQKNQLQHSQPQPIYMIPKRMFSSSSSTNLEAMGNDRHLTTRSQSISSSTSQFFNNQNIADPYFYILTDRIPSLRLGLEPINYDSPFKNTLTFPQQVLRSIRDSMTEANGKFLRFSKDCNWIPTRTEIMFNDDIENNPRCVLRIIKCAVLYREETVVTNKFFTIGSNPKVTWKKCYGVLTMCGFFIFDNLNFMTSEQEEKLLSNEQLEEPLVIDISTENPLKSCTKLSLNGLFACQSTQQENDHLHNHPNNHPNNHFFNIISTNKKELFSAPTLPDMSHWIIWINYIASLDLCYWDHPKNTNHEMVPIRNISIEDKISKLNGNLPMSKKKIDELMKLQKHLRVVTPLSSKTKEELMAHHQAINIRLDWLWYEVERNQAYLSILRNELIQNDSNSIRATDDDSFLEDSFFNDDGIDKPAKGSKSKLNLVIGENDLCDDAASVKDSTCVLVNEDGSTQEVDPFDFARRSLEDLIEETTFIEDETDSPTKSDGTTPSSDDECDVFVDAFDTNT